MNESAEEIKIPYHNFSSVKRNFVNELEGVMTPAVVVLPHARLYLAGPVTTVRSLTIGPLQLATICSHSEVLVGRVTMERGTAHSRNGCIVVVEEMRKQQEGDEATELLEEAPHRITNSFDGS